MSQHALKTALALVVVVQLLWMPSRLGATGAISTRVASVTVAQPGLDREVFGFALASSLSDPTVGYPSWRFSLLSTVAFFGLHITSTGAIAADPDRTVWNSSQLTGL